MITAHPGHDITVTRIGPAWDLDCTCDLPRRRFASRLAANRTGLVHHHAVGGCNCPPEVVDHASHPVLVGVA